ncbi:MULTISPECIES: TetR/AcrR family transcriptional regulator [Alphaproteobacteria]|jgi:AcrR family transcriptional regulator|uniref:TetR/AcrR family transcriptional regulator n=3 Tax=Alphaproteobacteria TaxID=28211 RepID=A0A6L3YEB7_9HYPH|nr:MULTISPECIES: TetR/AcrR family transcriptional regulator [Alphaproteobacteria]KZZ22461.1 TetR family transcriptional regulator [Sulfitobacter sp. HI0082]MBA3038659.1 TetR/AcrR family transcriptional regulator [Rhizobiaceae bacterium]KAB2680302.1 TetR/AcrR family transcriptional regulator [Brucella tritici]MBN9217119.1 TetR family transcriptional regulator [Mesorhizobium sp.]MDO7837538.1 TetR/AcrR family transcriptional regulator [Sphingobium sp. HBC34]
MKQTKTKPRMGRPPVLENARDRILDEAAVLFGEGGFDNGSMNVVAERLGVSKAAVYHYFDTKQSVYDAIIVRTLEGLLEHVSRAVAASTTADGKLKSFMVSHAGYFEKNYWGFVCMLIGYGGMANPGLKSEANQLRIEYESILRGILREGMATGAFREADVTISSHSVLSMLNWMVRWFKPGGQKRAETVAAEYFDLLTNGLYSR